MHTAGMDVGGTAPTPFIRLVDHPLRWRLLTALAGSDMRVRELAQRLDEPQNLVSYHLRILRDGGLVTWRQSSYDGRDAYYHVDLDRCADGLAGTGEALHPSLRMAVRAPAEVPVSPAAVLFVCSGNSARSPMAEALLRLRSGGRVAVASAGIVPKDRIHPHAIRVLREQFRIDISEQTPRSVDDIVDARTRFGRVVTLCDKAREQLPALDGRRRVHWSIPDPADARGRASYSAFVAVSRDIDARVRHLLPTLVTKPNEPHRMEVRP